MSPPAHSVRGVGVSGVGIVAPNGYDAAAWAGALRAGRSAAPLAATKDRWWPLVGLDDDRVFARLEAELGWAGLTRLPGVRGPDRILRAGATAALEALRTSGALAHPPDRIGVVVAGHNLTVGRAERVASTYQRSRTHVPPSAAVRMWDSDLVGILSQAFGIRGEGAVVGGASASGLVAAHQAALLLGAGRLDACLVVAPPLELVGWQAQAFAAAGAMSHSFGPCLPFDRRRDGFVPGEAAAAVVLEPHEASASRGADPLAHHAGSASCLSATSGAEPSADAEERVVRAALEDAGRVAEDVGYVNAHATASVRGDLVELDALGKVLPRAWLNSTKALVGHTLTAAGLVEYVATVLQMTGRFVHPMPHLTDSDPLGSLRVPTCESVAWDGRVAVTTSYAFGGMHTAAVLSAREPP